MQELTVNFHTESPAEGENVESLIHRTFGPGRFARTVYRLREDTSPDLSLSFVAYVGPLIVGSNRMFPILCGGQTALLSGAVTVEPAFRGQGIGTRLIKYSLEAASQTLYHLVLLVGDKSYYHRFGFQPVPSNRLHFPGPVDPERFLYYELRPGALEKMSGKVEPYLQ